MAAIKRMSAERRLDIWDRFDRVGCQCIRLRDGSEALSPKSARHDYIEHIIDLRDQLKWRWRLTP